MPLTLPNLDDRDYDALVEEARSLLVTFAPDLTNQNPSDPLITLIELFAYFTEILLFRLNVVTDANRIAFLRLLNGPDAAVPDPGDPLDAAIRDTVLTARRVDRAVTAADFEFLALSAVTDGSIARARCLPGLNLEITDAVQRLTIQPGHVSVVVVPAPGAILKTLTTAVGAYLDLRRLLTTQVHVVGPNTVPVRVRVTLHLLPDVFESVVLPLAIQALNTFFDPITGGTGSGWPFGRNVYVSEIYKLLDGVAGVDFVEPTVDTVTGAPLDELVTSADFSGRFERGAANNLISLPLQPDELVDSTVVASDFTIVLPISS
jgi:hypothetical protein